MLRSVAERVLASSGPSTTVARLSGDEFAVLVENVTDREQIEVAARRYLRSANISHQIDGNELSTTISLGIAVGPDDGEDAETLLKNADLALYRAKADGRNTFRFFTSAMDREVHRRRLVEHEMRKALGSEQFTAHYQPQLELASGALTGFEALARWEHPALGNVSPGLFVPIAEECGLIGELGERVLRHACEAATAWPEPVTVAVNLSVAQFRSSDVAEMVERTLRETGLEPERLEVEITETLFLHNTEVAAATLRRLRALGVGVALDDFGTGYSSLGYLSRFPFDKIKIDRSFVQRLATDKNTAAIVQAIITLGNALGVTILAEGVETHAQAAILRKVGCQQAQGFLFGKPAAQPRFEPAAPEVRRLQGELYEVVG